MRTYIVILTLLFGFVSFAQKPNNFNIYIPSPERPIVVINNDIIANVDVLLKAVTENVDVLIQPKLEVITKDRVEEIIQMDIVKEAELSSKNLFPLDKQSAGILRVGVEGIADIEAKTQPELNAFFDLDADNDIYVNGYLLEDKQLRISSKSIKSIELRAPDGLILNLPALNITIE